MSDLSEMERDVVEAAISMALYGNVDGMGSVRLTLLDRCVERVLKIRAETGGETIDQYVDRKRKLYTALG